MPTLKHIMVARVVVTTSTMDDAKQKSFTWPDAADARRAGAILTIDLGAIKNNWNIYNNAGTAKAGAVIKAGGYGLDARHVGVALAVAGCKTFFVATIDEGITLRSVLGDEPEIFILGCIIDGNEKDLSHHGLSPVLNSLSDIKSWKKFSSTDPCALHIDTGMNRLGLGAKDVKSLAVDKDALSEININLIMSHLACGDEPSNPMNAGQLATFKNFLKESLASINKSNARTSLANSSGVFLGDEYHLDMVRPGAALFGVNPTPENASPTSNPMAQVIRLQGKILQVRKIDTPQAVGYGSTHKADGPMKIATIAAGYADGLNRSLGNNGVAYINEHPAPFVGRVSMDLITIDVSQIPENVAHPGAMVDLIGPNNPVDDVAMRAGTIGYEILTSLGDRYHRVYVDGAKN